MRAKQPKMADTGTRDKITIMAGLGFATLLTLFIVPVLYSIFFRVPYRDDA